MTFVDRQITQAAAAEINAPALEGNAGPQPEHDAMQEVHAFADTRYYLIFGAIIVALLLGGVGVWGATSKISGAVVAQGHVVVDSNVKKVQHPTGGVIGEIRVKEGDRVEAGELLVRLDDTVNRANLRMVAKQIDEIAVRRSRLRAERDDKATLEFPAALVARQDEPLVAEIMASELALFESRRSSRKGLQAQLRERISQVRQEVGGLEAQERAKTRELGFAREELAGLEKLENLRLVTAARITSARRSVAQIEGDLAQVIASAAQARGKIAEIELQIMQLELDFKTEVGNDLRDQQAKAAELVERRVAAEDSLKRTDMRAPQAGVVHQLAVHTIGGVVTPSEPVMMIVPEADRLVIEARIAPQDIDQVKIGNIAEVRFTAFNQRTTPVFEAVVTRISADLMNEAAAGQLQQTMSPSRSVYYVVRLELVDDATVQTRNLKLIPGMPAEVYIKTVERTAVSYLMKPVADQFARAFRER